jgi:hypothetical protein
VLWCIGPTSFGGYINDVNHDERGYVGSWRIARQIVNLLKDGSGSIPDGMFVIRQGLSSILSPGYRHHVEPMVTSVSPDSGKRGDYQIDIGVVFRDGDNGTHTHSVPRTTHWWPDGQMEVNLDF